jgi:hypothetical protein
MKLCPQCEFIYEDEQSFCDMDGAGLVHNPAADPPISRLIIPLVFDKRSLTKHSSSITAPALVVIVLAGLVVAAYFTRTRQTLAQSYPEPTQSSLQTDLPTQAAGQSSVQSVTDQASTTADVAQTSNAEASETASAPNQPDENSTSPEANSSRALSAHARLNPGPVSASSETTNNRAPVVIRLTNGAVIKADEAWEKKDGVWFRREGVVTFVKRSRVRAIERAPVSTHSSTTRNAATNSSNQPAKSADTRDRLHIAKLEPVKPKKDSRVTSFLKKTGQLIKKPFRF